MKTTTILFATSLAFCTSAAFGQSLDLSSRLGLLNRSNDRQTTLKSLSVTRPDLHRVIITVDHDSDKSMLERAGIATDLSIGRYVVTTVNDDRLALLDTLDGVSHVTSVRKKRLLMDQARLSGRVDDIAADATLGTITGKDVIVGIIDNGFDPNHITFADSEGNSRVKRFWNYTSSGNVREYTSDNITSFTTDDIAECHATHVSAIAAGSRDNKYVGVAPETEIVMASGDLGDDMILSAVSRMIDYADSQGKPLVINLSLGDNLGPHDGTDPFTSALDELASEAVVCVAAGNEGDYDISIKKTFSSNVKELKTVMLPNSDLTGIYGSRYQAYCDVSIWSDDNTPFTAFVAFVNRKNGNIIDRVEATESASVYSVGNADITGISNATLSANYSNSFFAMQKSLSSSNNRYCCEMTFDLCNKSTSPEVYPAIIVEGEAGQTIRIYNDGWYTDFSNGGLTGFDHATADGTISNMACGKNTISVGAYVTKRLSPYNYGFNVGEAAYFTSWGTLADGRTLPVISAPGVAVVSALSTPHARSRYYSSAETPKTLSETVGDNTYWWTPMGGTSMATPFVSGTAALWLQAAPSLTPDVIQKIAVETAMKPSDNNPQWGAGRIDAFNGLKRALEVSGTDNVVSDVAAYFKIAVDRSNVTVFSADNIPFTATLLDITGKTIAGTSSADGMALIETQVAPGLYLVTVRRHDINRSFKVILR